MLFKKGADIVLIILKERRFPISGLQCVPMQMTPIAMIADSDVLNKWRVEGGEWRVTFHWHRQSLDAVSGGNETTVTICLLLEALPLFNHHMFSPMQFLIPLHRAEIGCTH